MKYNWTHLTHKGGRDFNEEYTLSIEKKGLLSVQVNRPRKIVKITVDWPNEKSLQSVIMNGTVIRERDILNNKAVDLDEPFTDLRWELSSLPDSEVLRLIGGNYGVLTEFTGTAKVRAYKKDIESVADLMEWLRAKSIETIRRLRSFFKGLVYFPKIWDIIDTAIFGGIGYSVYLINFNFFHAGIMACMGAFIGGLSDIVFRNRQPYILKVLALLIPGTYAMLLGYRLQ